MHTPFAIGLIHYHCPLFQGARIYSHVTSLPRIYRFAWCQRHEGAGSGATLLFRISGYHPHEAEPPGARANNRRWHPTAAVHPCFERRATQHGNKAMWMVPLRIARRMSSSGSSSPSNISSSIHRRIPPRLQGITLYAHSAMCFLESLPNASSLGEDQRSQLHADQIRCLPNPLPCPGDIGGNSVGIEPLACISPRS